MTGARARRVGAAMLVLALFGVPLFVGLRGLDLGNDEAIHSLAAESLLVADDWLTPHAPMPQNAFIEKPPLKFWLVAAPIRWGLLKDNEFGLRFWDALFGAAALLYVFGIGLQVAGPLCGLFATCVLFSFDPLVFVHGLRSNNMDASVVLAYCGGVYHYLRWAAAEEDPPARRHALAVGLYVVLGFMTKFVAVLFLPLVLGATTLMMPEVLARFLRQWRTWAVVTLVVVGASAPWFLYQWARTGREFWHVLIGEHVLRRFNSWLDITHLQPWPYCSGRSAAR